MRVALGSDERTPLTDAVAGVPADYTTAVLDHTLAPLATLLTTEQVLATWSGP